MAQGIQLKQTNFCCSVCLNLLKDPVTIPCGHSYCRNCINEHWDKEDYRRMYSCPQCRQSFTVRPVLGKNTMLADLVEELKKTRLQAADHCCAGDEDVSCDFCTGQKLKAIKSCLQCFASYCETHLQPHYDVAALKKHTLVEAPALLQEYICSHHQEVMKMFCRTDQCCICYLCAKDDHKGHDKVSTAAARDMKQEELAATRQKIQQGIMAKEKDVKVIKLEEEAINYSAEKALENTEKTFAELVRVIERRISDMKQQIKSLQKTEVRRFNSAREKLEQEIAELKKKDAELEKLSCTENHIHFLLTYPALSHFCGGKKPPSIRIRRLRYFEKVTVAAAEARSRLQAAFNEEYSRISMTVSETGVLSTQNTKAEPMTRDEFLQHASQITLDPNTANTHLVLSKENRKATFTYEEQKYSSHAERFAYSWQVLSKEGLTGRCYWEVVRSGRGVLVAVTYKDISRDGNFKDCVFGHNNKSWVLDCYKNSYEFRHNGMKTTIPGTWSPIVGVFLDHRAGLLSFYSVSETMTLLHRVQTTFTQPLHAGLWLSDGATAEFCKLK